MNVSLNDLSLGEVARLRRRFRMEVVRNYAVVLLFASISSGLALSVIRGFVPSFTWPWITAVALLIGTAFVLVLHRQYAGHVRALFEDVRAAKAEVVECNVLNFLFVTPRGSWPAMILDAGAHCVLCFNGWWELNRHSHIQWSGLGKDGFPSTQLQIRVLPRSGRVISVATTGTPVHRSRNVILQDDAPDPILLGEHSSFADCQILIGPLAQWIEKHRTDSA